MPTNITINDLTNTTTVVNGVANGTGVFDKLMNTTNLYLKDQFDSSRLKGTDYATVLLGSMQTIITQSIQYVLQERVTEVQIDTALKDLELKTYEKDVLSVDKHNESVAQIDMLNRKMTEEEATGTKQRANLQSQISLYDRQRTGFDDDAKQKLIKTAMDSWSVMFSSAPDGDLIPDTITRQNIDKMMENAMIALSMNETATTTFGSVAASNTLDGAYLDTPITAQG